MAKKRPSPSMPYEQITRGARAFGPDTSQQESDPTAPGMGKPSTPSPVALSSVDLDKLANEFSQEIDYQRSAQQPFFEKLVKWNDLYDGKPKQETKDYPFSHASNVVVQLAKIFSNQVIARIYQGINGIDGPQWMVQQINKKFAATCKPYERYLDWASKNTWDQKRFLLPFIQDCVKLGTAIGYNDFVNEPVIRYNDQEKKTEVIGYRKGPRPTWVAREDFLMPIGYDDLQKTPWFSHRVWFSWDLLERLAWQGFIQDLDMLRGHSDEEDDYKQQRRKYRDQIMTNHPDDRFGLWAPEYVWFRRDLDQDGYPEEYTMMLHPQTKTILRLVANPSPSGMRPYFKAAFINVQGQFDGIGIPEDVEQLQEEASTIHNQRRDRAHLSNIVMYIAKTVFGPVDTIRPKSGLVIKSPGGAEDIREFSPSMGQIPIDMSEEQMVMALGAQTVGMNDIDTGKMSSPMGRAAATTTMAMMQEGARRFDLNVTGIRQALTDESHQITELWQVYGLPAPDEAGSPEQVLDEEDASMVRALLEQPASLRGIINIQLNATTAAVNRTAEQQANMQLLGTILQYNQQALQMASLVANPAIPPEMKTIIMHTMGGMDSIYTKLFQSFSAFDLETVLAGDVMDELYQKSMQQLQQMQQMGVDPTMMARAQAQQGGIPPQAPGGGAKPSNGAAQ